jgi:hypothetical protein
MTIAGYEAWYTGKSFTSDWTTLHFQTWASILGGCVGKVANVLEIGSWEGRSAIFWLNYFPHSRVVCLDTFAGSDEHQLPLFAGKVGEIEQRFDGNTAEFGNRVEKFKARSCDALAYLGVTKRRFDFIYVDGSHRAADVYSDAILAWPMLNPGGAMLFDDYTWIDMPNEMDRPKLGVDTFLEVAAGSFRELHRDLQILLEKTENS